MIVTIKDKYRRLVEKLFESTLSGYLAWRYMPAAEYCVTEAGGKEIRLSMDHNDDGEPIVIVEIINEMLDRKEKFSDDDIRGGIPNIEEYNSYWNLMKDMYDFIVRKATGADKDIDDILDHLDNDIPF